MRDKAFNIAKNTKQDRYQRALATMVCNFFDKKTSAMRVRLENLVSRNKFVGSGIKSENMSNKQLAEGLNKRIFRTFGKQKVQSPLVSNI